MNTGSKIGIWFSRFVLSGAGILFTMISIRYLSNPVGATSPFKISLGTATAITNVRIGFGAFPLAFAIVLFSCLLKTRRLLTGLYFLGVLISVATIVRIIGVMVDGATTETLKVLRPEILLFCLTAISIVIEYRRRQLHNPDLQP
jgi:hypothetical protein